MTRNQVRHKDPQVVYNPHCSELQIRQNEIKHLAPQQQVKVVHRPHPHSIHSLDLLPKLMMPQLTDLLGPVRLTPRDLPQDPLRQLVTQAQSDEALLTLQPHRLVVRRVQPQIMLMEVPLRHLRYSVVSSQHQKMVHKVH